MKKYCAQTVLSDKEARWFVLVLLSLSLFLSHLRCEFPWERREERCARHSLVIHSTLFKKHYSYLNIQSKRKNESEWSHSKGNIALKLAHKIPLTDQNPWKCKWINPEINIYKTDFPFCTNIEAILFTFIDEIERLN